MSNTKNSNTSASTPAGTSEPDGSSAERHPGLPSTLPAFDPPTSTGSTGSGKPN